MANLYSTDFPTFVEATATNEGPQLAGGDLKAFGLVLELAAETGEVVEVFQKASRRRKGRLTAEDIDQIFEEVGDVLWAVQALCNHFEFSEEHIKESVMQKLRERLNAED